MSTAPATTPIMAGQVPQRALIYCRISRDDARTGLAVERQEHACRSLADARGWEVVGVETDNAVSAWSGVERPGWGRVLTRIEEGEVDVVVAYHLDRITRSMLDLEKLILMTQDRGVGIATATGDIDLTTDVGRMVARILAAVARAEVERKGERQRLAEQQRVSKGKPRWSHRPFGYEKDGTFREDEAELLREAYARLRRGERYYVIRDEWNEMGYYTTMGNPWTTQSLRNLIRDPRNCGRIVYQGKDAGKGNWEGIVSEDEWHATVNALDSRKAVRGPAPKSDAWLVTVATCSECDGRIFTSKERSGVRHYACQRGCVSLPVRWVDAQVLYKVTELLADEEARKAWRWEVETERENLAQARERLRIKVERLESLGDDYAAGLIERETLLKATDRLRGEIADLENEVASLGGDDADGFDLTDLEYVTEQLITKPVDEVRTFLRGITGGVVLHRRGKGSRQPKTRRLVTFKREAASSAAREV